jgi:hypothetical protein
VLYSQIANHIILYHLGSNHPMLIQVLLVMGKGYSESNMHTAALASFQVD